MALNKKDLNLLLRWLRQCEMLEVIYAGYHSDPSPFTLHEEDGIFEVEDGEDWEFDLADFKSLEFDAGRGTMELTDTDGDILTLIGYTLELVQWVEE